MPDVRMSDELAYLPICGPCVRGEGSECHTPGCALWLRDVPPDGLISEFALDLSEVRREGAVEAIDAAAMEFEVDNSVLTLHERSVVNANARYWLRHRAAALRGDA